MKERVECFAPVDCASRSPAVVMADDGLRSTAVELVRLGAYGYCRRPPSIRELKAMLAGRAKIRCSSGSCRPCSQRTGSGDAPATA